MKKKIISLLSIASIALIAVGCTKVQSPTDAELNSLTNFTFQNEEYVNSVLEKYELDEGFKLDGKLTESVWRSDATAWTFENALSTTENPIALTTKSYYGDYGVYIAFSVTDKAVYYSDDRTASGNSSVEIYIADGKTTEWNGNSFRISIVPSGNNECVTEMWTYRPKFGMFTEEEPLEAAWRKWYKPHIAACSIRGEGINTAKNEGYDVELFIPYDSFGIAEKPEIMQYMTGFNHVEGDSTESLRQWTGCHKSANTKKLGTWLFATNETIGFFNETAQIVDSSIVVDEEIVLDGELNESAWNTYNGFVQSAVKQEEGVNAMLTWKTYMTDLGVYIGTQIRTNNIYASASRDVKYNTGLEFWVQNTEQETLTNDSVHIRVDALGNLAKFKTNKVGEFVQAYFPSRSAVKLLGCEASDGIVSSSTAEGFGVETFIPWSSLGMSEKAEQIALFPQYAQAMDTTSTNTSGDKFQFFCLTNQETAKKESKSCFITLGANAAVELLDGAVSENEYPNYMDYQVSTSTGQGSADIRLHWREETDAIYFAFEVTETGKAKYLTNTGSGNQGTAGVNFFVKNHTVTEGYKGFYYRACASGIVRYKDLSKLGSDTTYYPGAPTLLDYVAGSHTVAAGDETQDDNITSYVIEFKITYESVGATSANDLSFVFGWITADQLDRAHEWTTGYTTAVGAASLTDLTKEKIWYTYDKLVELSQSAQR